MSKIAFVLSPHLDDGILSCSGHIQIWKEQNDYEIFIICVFSKSSFEREREYLLRKKEDERACKIMGAHVLHLDFLDAPFRLNDDFTFKNLLSLPFNLKLKAAVQKQIQNLISCYQPELIVGPLGLGHHLDHRLCFQVMQDLEHSNKLFYSDIPYAGVNEHFDHLKGKSIKWSEKLFKNLFEATYIKNFANSKDRLELTEFYLNYKNPSPHEISLVSQIQNDKYLETSLKAISQYSSQLPQLFDNLKAVKNDLFNLESLWRVDA